MDAQLCVIRHRNRLLHRYAWPLLPCSPALASRATYAGQLSPHQPTKRKPTVARVAENTKQHIRPSEVCEHRLGGRLCMHGGIRGENNMGMRRHLCMPDLADGDRNKRDAGSSADNADGAAVAPRPYVHRSAVSTPVPPSLYVMTMGIWTYVT